RCVVPAKRARASAAGTHTPRPCFGHAGRRLSLNSNRLWLWIPAFARTTLFLRPPPTLSHPAHEGDTERFPPRSRKPSMSTAVSPLAPTDVPAMPEIAGVKLATAAAGIRYEGRTDVLPAVMD